MRELRTSDISQVPAVQRPLLADLPQDGPRLAYGAAMTTVLVRLTELAALVLTVR
jgi:hypothetical protein